MSLFLLKSVGVAHVKGRCDMFDIEKMKAKGMDPQSIEICRKINENSAKRDSCHLHEFEEGSRP